MISLSRILLIVCCFVFICCILLLVAKKKLLLKYSLLWIALGVAFIFCALFPDPLFFLSNLAGFESPSNFLFVVAIAFLFLITLSLSRVISQQVDCIKNLTQAVGLLQKELKETRCPQEDYPRPLT